LNLTGGALFVALQVTQAAAAMPLRVRRIDNTLEQLEAGDLKLRWALLEHFTLL
jgi:hypothetical protein